jgi:hypothetical protein
MANVNISVQDGTATAHPFKVPIGGLGRDLTVIWNLAPGSAGWKFASTPEPGIVCEKKPPLPFHAWDGGDAIPGDGPTQYKVEGVKVILPKTYKYSIHLVNDAGETIDVDPEIMNDPFV